METIAGILSVRVRYDNSGDFYVTIDMGVPACDATILSAVDFCGFSAEVTGMTIYSVNIGVPHAVIFLEDIEDIDLDAVVLDIRHNAPLPVGINVTFAQVISPSTISIRTFVRGIEEEMLSCVNGFMAAVLIAVKFGKVLDDEVHVETIGGSLDISIGERATIMGSAETVFTGEIPL
ncbi:MAG TPA: hypothetical protein O0W81_03680 [Methanocorpusculum sp.]|nr:hypothetical protein [Methanocorpusculum sp.]